MADGERLYVTERNQYGWTGDYDDYPYNRRNITAQRKAAAKRLLDDENVQEVELAYRRYDDFDGGLVDEKVILRLTRHDLADAGMITEVGN